MYSTEQELLSVAAMWFFINAVLLMHIDAESICVAANSLYVNQQNGK